MIASVPVLMYHHVLPAGDNMAISTELFSRQMAWLAEHGWQTLSAAQFLAYKRGELQVPRKSVLLTFDDGWLDNYLYAYPVLKQYGHQAVLFLVTDWVARASRRPPAEAVTWRDHREAVQLAQHEPQRSVLHLFHLQAMADVFDFQSHTHRHQDRRREKIDFAADLEASQAFFRAQLGAPATQLCYPWGYYQPGDADIARICGFDLCYTVKNGANPPDGRRDEIKRFAVKNKSLAWLARKLLLFGNRPLATLYGALRKQ